MPPPKNPTLTVFAATPLASRSPLLSVASCESSTSKSTVPLVWSNGFSSSVRGTHGFAAGSRCFLRTMLLLLPAVGAGCTRSIRLHTDRGHPAPERSAAPGLRRGSALPHGGPDE